MGYFIIKNIPVNSKEKNISTQQNRYIPALGSRWLTFLYDPATRLLAREHVIKCRLVKLAQLKPGHRVLDIGCGTATLTIWIKQSQPEAHVIGLDSDSGVLQFAKPKKDKAGVDIELVQAMAYQLPFPDASFNRVFASMVIHHLSEENKSLAFAEVLRILKPGGEMHIAEFGKPHNTLMHLISLVMRHLEDTSLIIKGLLPKMLKKAGFSQVEETDRFGTPLGTFSLYRAKK